MVSCSLKRYSPDIPVPTPITCSLVETSLKAFKCNFYPQRSCLFLPFLAFSLNTTVWFPGDIVDCSTESPPCSLKSRTHSMSTGRCAVRLESSCCLMLLSCSAVSLQVYLSCRIYSHFPQIRNNGKSFLANRNGMGLTDCNFVVPSWFPTSSVREVEINKLL